MRGTCSWLPLSGSLIGPGPPHKWCDLGWKAEADPEEVTAGGPAQTTLLTAEQRALFGRGIGVAHLCFCHIVNSTLLLDCN